MKMKLMSNVLKEREREREKREENNTRRVASTANKTTQTKQINAKQKQEGARDPCVRTKSRMFRAAKGTITRKKTFFIFIICKWFAFQLGRSAPRQKGRKRKKKRHRKRECAIKVRFTMKGGRKRRRRCVGVIENWTFRRNDASHFAETSNMKLWQRTHAHARMTMRVWFVCVRVVGRANRERERESNTEEKELPTFRPFRHAFLLEVRRRSRVGVIGVSVWRFACLRYRLFGSLFSAANLNVSCWQT